MNLAIVGPYPPNITGISQYGYHVSQSLAQSGQFERITILADAPLTVQPPVDVAAPIQVEHVWRRSEWNAGLKIMQRLRTLKPDLVWFNMDVSSFGHSPLANLTGFLTPLAARHFGLPSVVTLHELIELADLRTLKAPGGPLAPYAARMMTYLATRTDVVCLTMRHYVEWLAAHEPQLHCVHIPIGAYRPPALLPEHNEPELLLFGMMSPFKGLETLLEAFHRLRAGPYPNLRLTIAGGVNARFPTYAQRWQETTRNIDGIRWLGRVPEADLPALFGRAQIVVLPYTASVGASSVLYQAAGWGRTIVASDLTETQTLAHESGLNVRFFPRGDAQSLAEQLRVLLDSPTTRRQQIEHNLTAMQRTRPEDICHAYLHAFNLALETCQSPKRLTITKLETA